ncbi:MAG: ABC transporter permease [Bacteroidales bacterium]|nr:ABC transporter permease [Bacteroidales bacterium]
MVIVAAGEGSPYAKQRTPNSELRTPNSELRTSKHQVNLELYIARRLRTGDKNSRLSAPSVRIATIGIALGLTVMILAVAIITGFKQEVSDKVIGIGSHIRISNFDSNNSFESHPIDRDSIFVRSLMETGNVKAIQAYTTKPGIIRANEQMQGIVLKGYDSSFDPSFINNNLTEGKATNFGNTQRSDSVLISRITADALLLNVGDDFITYFFQDRIKARKFIVAGIFNTNLTEFDELFLLCDLRHIQSLNKWERNQISGYEVTIKDFEKIDEIAYETYLLSANRLDKKGSSLISRNIKEIYPQIFGWLDIIDVNVWVILVLMLLVSGVNMISGVLILILERSTTIGILKAMGQPDWNIRKVFLYLSGFLVTRGMLWGNAIAISICLLQQHFSIIPLDPVNYYVDAVPINLKLTHLLLLNIGTLVTIVAMMVIPSVLITKISPIKSIQFD